MLDKNDYIDSTHKQSVEYVQRLRRYIGSLKNQQPHVRPTPADFMRQPSRIQRLQTPKNRTRMRHHD